MRETKRRRILLPALAALALAGFAAGCGDDDDDSDGGSAEVSTLAIEATSAKPPTFDAPETAEAGAAKIEFTNGTGDEVDGQLVRVDGERSDEDVIGELGRAMQGKPVADWFHAAGGVGSTKPGETGSVTQVLEPGTYYVLGGEDAPKELAKITVEGEGGAELPESDGTVVATDYAFEGENLKAGAQQIEMRNDGKEWHHFLAGELKKDASIEDARKFLTSEEGPPPFASEEGAVETTVMDGGVSQVVDVNLKAGRYVFFCLISDRKGGPPHVAKGMISEVTVEG